MPKLHCYCINVGLNAVLASGSLAVGCSLDGRRKTEVEVESGNADHVSSKQPKKNSLREKVESKYS